MLGRPTAVLPVSARATQRLKARRRPVAAEAEAGRVAERVAGRVEEEAGEAEKEALGAPLEAWAEGEAEQAAAAQWQGFELAVRDVLRGAGRYKMSSQLATASRLLHTHEAAQAARRQLQPQP